MSEYLAILNTLIVLLLTLITSVLGHWVLGRYVRKELDNLSKIKKYCFPNMDNLLYYNIETVGVAVRRKLEWANLDGVNRSEFDHFVKEYVE